MLHPKLVARPGAVLALVLFCLVSCTPGERPAPSEDEPPDGGQPPGGGPPGEAPHDGGNGEEVGPVAEVHRIGRFDDDGRFDWPGTSMRARFVGSTIAIELADSGINRFEVVVDGEVQPVLAPSEGVGTYVLASGLDVGEHEVVVTRRTEPLFGESAFLGFSGAELVPSEGEPRFIEFVGDSITAGFGVLADTPDCGLDPITEAETYAWGALAAERLDASHVAIAHSGKGVYRNGGGDMDETMPVLYGRTVALDPSSVWDHRYTPDVVVVALGTNDFAMGDPGEAFVGAYAAFLGSLRVRYPDAWLLVAESPMLDDSSGEMRRTIARGYFEDVVAAREADGDERVALVEIAEQEPSDGYGCAMHPSAVTHEKMADQLVARVEELVGW